MDLEKTARQLGQAYELIKSGQLKFEPNTIQAAAIVLLLFILVLTLAQLRRRFMSWHIKGIMPGVALGFVLALVLEGFLIVGGRTVVTEVLGWKNAPKPLTGVLDAGRNKLVQVMGVTDEIPTSVAKEDVSVDEIIGDIYDLDSEEISRLRELVCEP